MKYLKTPLHLKNRVTISHSKINNLTKYLIRIGQKQTVFPSFPAIHFSAILPSSGITFNISFP